MIYRLVLLYTYKWEKVCSTWILHTCTMLYYVCTYIYIYIYVCWQPRDFRFTNNILYHEIFVHALHHGVRTRFAVEWFQDYVPTALRAKRICQHDDDVDDVDDRGDVDVVIFTWRTRPTQDSVPERAFGPWGECLFFRHSAWRVGNDSY